MFEIEKNIPVVPRTERNTPFAKEVRDTLTAMEATDSFAYEDATPSKALNRTIRAIARELKIQVTVRAIKNKDNQFRVWKL